MDGTVNIVLAGIVIAGTTFLFCFWFSPRGCQTIADYFGARAVALPKKRAAILAAREQYHQEMMAVCRRPVEVMELKRGKA